MIADLLAEYAACGRPTDVKPMTLPILMTLDPSAMYFAQAWAIQ